MSNTDVLLGHTFLLFPGFSPVDAHRLSTLILRYGGAITTTVASATYISESDIE